MLDFALIEQFQSKFVVGLLILIRVSGLFASGPFFKHSAIIPQVRIILTMFMAVLITSAYYEKQPTIEFHLWGITFLAIKEFMVGLALGFAANIVFFASRFAGGLVDAEMGFNTSMLFDRENATPSLIGEFKELITFMLFLLIDGHHYIVQGIFISFDALPLDSFVFTSSTIQVFIKLATVVLVLGIKMASPILIALFLTNLGLALLARVAPQTNVFILSFQLKVAVGLLVLTVTIPVFIMVSKFALYSIESTMMELLITLNPLRVP